MSNFIDRLLSRVGLVRADSIQTSTSTIFGVTPEINPRQYFQLLDYYYQNNATYDALTRLARGMNANLTGLQPLRNPAFRVVEFYVSTVWPGTGADALPIEADNDAIVQPIEELWKWSNWAAQKQVAVRHLAKLGNLFIKVAQREDGRPFLQLMDSLYATELEEDSRGVVQRLRVDVPKVRDAYTANARPYTYTEVWDLDGYRVYEHERGDSDEAQLPNPTDSGTLADIGLDFVPIVHGKLRDVGSKWGMGAFGHALDKIDEANRKATRQSQMLFRHNKALWAAMANGVGADNRPLPPPRFNNADGTAAGDNFIAELGDDAILKMPGTSKLESLIPGVNYDAALKFLQDDMAELEADLPELAYARISRDADSSGVALRVRLTAAIANAKEARGNAEAALVRANQIALTIGQNAGVWSGLGDYESGALEHTFEERDIIPLSEDDAAGVQLKRAQAHKADADAGLPLSYILRTEGASDADLEQFATDLREKASSDSANLATAVLNAQRGFDQNAQPA